MDLMDYRRKIIANSPHLKSASGGIVSFSDGADLPLKSLLVNIDPVQSGSGDPSPSNIRPISGWSAVKVTRTGKNLLKPPTVSTSEHNGISFAYTSDGGIVCNGTSTGVAYSSVQNGFRLPVGQYVKNTQDSNGIGVLVQIKTSPNWTTVRGGGVSDRTVTINAEDTLYDLAVRIRIPSGITLNNYVYYPMLRFSGDSDTYEPYNGNTYNISLASAGTVYGGTLDVTTGVLTAYPYYASYNGETLTGEWISDRDKYVSGTTPTIGAQVVDMSGTGTEIQLTPQQIRTLYGQNNIFADTGNVALEYWAHP